MTYAFPTDVLVDINNLRLVDSNYPIYDVVSVIHASLELWPTLVEICYFHKDKKEFPQLRVNNKRLKNGHRTPSRAE